MWSSVLRRSESPAERTIFNIWYVIFRDFDISVKCENICTQLFLECLSECDDDDCYGECHRNDYVCVDWKKSCCNWHPWPPGKSQIFPVRVATTACGIPLEIIKSTSFIYQHFQMHGKHDAIWGFDIRLINFFILIANKLKSMFRHMFRII